MLCHIIRSYAQLFLQSQPVSKNEDRLNYKNLLEQHAPHREHEAVSLAVSRYRPKQALGDPEG